MAPSLERSRHDGELPPGVLSGDWVLRHFRCGDLAGGTAQGPHGAGSDGEPAASAKRAVNARAASGPRKAGQLRRQKCALHRCGDSAEADRRPFRRALRSVAIEL
jgi:hypothetical protein